MTDISILHAIIFAIFFSVTALSGIVLVFRQVARREGEDRIKLEFKIHTVSAKIHIGAGCFIFLLSFLSIVFILIAHWWLVLVPATVCVAGARVGLVNSPFD